MGCAEHLLGGLESGPGDLRAGDHAGDFGDPFLVADAEHARVGALAVAALFDDEVGVGEGGDLREVRDAEDLAMACDVGDGVADLLGDGAAHAGVDLVEDVEARGAVLGEDALQGEKGARELAARGDAAQGPGRGAGVGGDEELDPVDAVAREARPVDFELTTGAVELRDVDDDPRLAHAEKPELAADEVP